MIIFGWGLGVEYMQMINELLKDLDNMGRILHNQWTQTDERSRGSDVLNGQGIAVSNIKDLIKRKFNIGE